MRTWAKRVGFVGILALVAVSVFVITQRAELQARYLAHQLNVADSESERAARAAELIALGEPGQNSLLAPFRSGNEQACQAVVTALKAHLNNSRPADASYIAALRPCLSSIGTFAPAGVEVALGLVPVAVKSPELVPLCRDLVRAGLTVPNAAGRSRAVTLTLLPAIGLAAETAPLLADSEAGVRRAAMLVTGPAANEGAAVVDDETLFPYLHDPDAEVRDLCAAALRTRGLDDNQVALATKLASPNPADRLGLLLDLRTADGSVRDPGPWLERLSRDADPAVRAGAVRVGYESRLAFVDWIEKLAANDPDSTVRQLANYYQRQSAIRQTSGDEGR